MTVTSLQAFLSQWNAGMMQAGEPESDDRRLLLPSPDAARLAATFHELAPLLQVARRQGGFIDVWDIARVGRNEVRNCAVLAWMFDPRGSHGRGNAVFAAFIRRLRDKYPNAALPRGDLDDGFLVFREFNPEGDARNRVDLVVEGGDFVIFIEAKIDAVEGPNQLKRYLSLAETRARGRGKRFFAVIFLCQARNRLVTNQNTDHLIAASWREVAAAITDVERLTGDTDTFAARLLGQFKVHIRKF